jgi:hypothetical protein
MTRTALDTINAALQAVREQSQVAAKNEAQISQKQGDFGEMEASPHNHTVRPFDVMVGQSEGQVM